MASGNPAFRSNPVFNGKGVQDAPAIPTPSELQDLYNQPSANAVQTDRMSYDDTIMKTGFMFAILLATAVVGWLFPVLAIPGAIIGLVLGLVNSFKREPSPVLILLYAGFEGLFVGGISRIMESYAPGVVVQRGVNTGAARKYGWSAAFGLTVTIVWLYIEMLRLIAIFRQ